MTFVEFGQEVLCWRFFILVEIGHQVALLLEDIDCFLKFHFTLKLKTTLNAVD